MKTIAFCCSQRDSNEDWRKTKTLLFVVKLLLEENKKICLWDFNFFQPSLSYFASNALSKKMLYIKDKRAFYGPGGWIDILIYYQKEEETPCSLLPYFRVSIDRNLFMFPAGLGPIKTSYEKKVLSLTDYFCSTDAQKSMVSVLLNIRNRIKDGEILDISPDYLLINSSMFSECSIDCILASNALVYVNEPSQEEEWFIRKMNIELLITRDYTKKTCLKIFDFIKNL